ncbi:hypothetical protein V6N13_073955 [Hibiscus sabdariffa]
MSSNTPSFTMNGENECEGQLGAGDQDNGGRQENVTTDVGGINDGIQPGATDVGPEVSRVSPEIPRAESGVEAAVEQDVRSDDESICDDRLLSGRSDETVACVPEISVTNLPVVTQHLVTFIEKDMFDIVDHEKIIQRYQKMKPRREEL